MERNIVNWGTYTFDNGPIKSQVVVVSTTLVDFKEIIEILYASFSYLWPH